MKTATPPTIRPPREAPAGTPLTPPRLCPSCTSMHPVGTTCAGGWAPYLPRPIARPVTCTARDARCADSPPHKRHPVPPAPPVHPWRPCSP